jgi:formyltetrahydrofolate hydrolase
MIHYILIAVYIALLLTSIYILHLTPYHFVATKTAMDESASPIETLQVQFKMLSAMQTKLMETIIAYDSRLRKMADLISTHNDCTDDLCVTMKKHLDALDKRVSLVETNYKALDTIVSDLDTNFSSKVNALLRLYE